MDEIRKIKYYIKYILYFFYFYIYIYFKYIIKNIMSCSLSEFSDILGKPNEGIHSYRIFNLAIVDIIATIVGSSIISYLFKINFLNTLLFLVILAIILHRIFCVDTTINKLIFGKVNV
jgi:hypothetical protein